MSVEESNGRALVDALRPLLTKRQELYDELFQRLGGFSGAVTGPAAVTLLRDYADLDLGGALDPLDPEVTTEGTEQPWIAADGADRFPDSVVVKFYEISGHPVPNVPWMLRHPGQSAFLGCIYIPWIGWLWF